MVRLVACAVFALSIGTAAFAQQSGSPDPLVLPEKGRNSDEIVVPGTSEKEVELPQGDVRSAFQRSRDRARFDRCVMRASARENDDPGANPVASSPEEYCSQRLGMRDRNSPPDRRARSQ
jgi:hypothetical protein